MFLSLALFASLIQVAVIPELTRDEVVRRVIQRDPEVRRARLELEALTGRRTASKVILPSNPTLQMSLGRRSPGAGQPAFEAPGINWNVSISQELEIAGQRSLRLDIVDAEEAAQVRRLQAVKRESAATALTAFYQIVAAQRNLALANQVSEVARNLATSAQSRADLSLLAPVDADVAAAEALRLGLIQVEAERRLSLAQAVLAAFLGSENDVPYLLADDLSPLPMPFSDERDSRALLERAFASRAEVDAATEETRALNHQLALLRRQRVPNLTVSLFASQDSTAERVFGGGLAIPLPLPGPVGQTFGGQIAETLARIEQSRGDLTMVRRRVRLEVLNAIAGERMAARAAALFGERQIARAEERLAALSYAVEAHQLSIKEAVLSQRSLIELLQSHLQIQLQQASARLELMRACGVSFDGADP